MIISFNTPDTLIDAGQVGTIKVHKKGAAPGPHWASRGTSIKKFFYHLLVWGRYDMPFNKHVAVANLNTWLWVGVIRNDGTLINQRKFRHTMPEDIGGTPFWRLVKKEGQYDLLPVKEFVCKCGKSFSRYKGQTNPDICQEHRQMLSVLQAKAEELEFGNLEEAEKKRLQEEVDQLTQQLGVIEKPSPESIQFYRQ